MSAQIVKSFWLWVMFDAPAARILSSRDQRLKLVYEVPGHRFDSALQGIRVGEAFLGMLPDQSSVMLSIVSSPTRWRENEVLFEVEIEAKPD